eukprot:CAMPEP_0185839994 /NCGR_PEP_ID=MMETSP1353-20130828/15508_1 /TAXON_ID=1077150 /ORGANISM="Erythrolobus australicus, Strain CCMP3124" /LENGTH=296 /DNA_ID=CAMNT_0028539251 /DNA_START=188 /DNA_END=1078 /DNA_ORIENTATION=-
MSSQSVQLKPYMIADVPPRAFFLSDAAHVAFELALRDIEFAMLTDDTALFKNEFRNACRALDNYSCVQNAGWYSIMDSHFNAVCKKRNLYEYSASEFKLREPIAQLLMSENVKSDELEEPFNAWSADIRKYISEEAKLLRPFEDRLAPDIGVKVLANGGNDWEYLARYILVVLDNHKRINELVSFVLQLKAATALASAVERERLLPLIEKNVSSATYEKLKTAGFDYEKPGAAVTSDTDPALLKGISRLASGTPKLQVNKAGTVFSRTFSGQNSKTESRSRSRTRSRTMSRDSEAQ